MNKVMTWKGKTVVALVAMGSTSAAFAADQTAAITAASTEATANNTAVIAAVISLAVLAFGIKSLISWFK